MKYCLVCEVDASDKQDAIRALRDFLISGDEDRVIISIEKIAEDE